VGTQQKGGQLGSLFLFDSILEGTMTASGLIESIFSRPPWRGQSNNLRHVTREQLIYLRNLIERDPERGAMREGSPGSLVWSPDGPHKFVLTEDLVGDKHTLTRLRNIASSETGSLF
jgi:hypothetical protein